MASGNDDDNDAVLSDVEADDPAPPVALLPEDVSVDRFREVLAELDRERIARAEAENSKSELQVSFNRLKILSHDAIKKCDEISRQRNHAFFEKDEAVRSNEKLSVALSESARVKDEVMKQRDEFARQFEEALKVKASLRSEMETSAQMLVNGIEKISEKVSSFKNFTAGGLPRSQKYTGLPAVAFGVIKRTNDIVEELLSHNESTEKSRNETWQQMEQRNYEIAIEVSQLESTISRLREEVSKRTFGVQGLEKSIAEKDSKISEMEREMLEKENLAEIEVSRLRQLVSEYDDKLRGFELKMDLQRPLLVDQLTYVAKLHDQIYNVIKIIDANKLSELELSESSFSPQEKNMEKNLCASLAGMEFIYELSRHVAAKTRDLVDERNREVKSLNETLSQLVKEKEHIGSLLRSALLSKTSDILKITENGLKDAGIDFRSSIHLKEGKIPVSNGKMSAMVVEEDEISTLAGALENIIKQSQLEIIELQHTVDDLRAEAALLRQQVEAQVKELMHKKHCMEELEEEERLANNNVEGLMMDVAAAEEEITRWKVVAQQEAAAGKAVEQEFVAKLSAVSQALEEMKQAVIESEVKLKYKEETADAAMAARDLAEKSLKLADLRTSRLRDKVEELTHQLEELDKGETLRTGQKRPRFVCWPWQWIGLNLVDFHPSETPHKSPHEMELSQPLL
ncbi:hypothetical protein LguiB_016265 [Lonicera macranthoides]